MKFAEFLNNQTGMKNPKVTNKKDAIEIGKRLQSMGFKLKRKDGTEFDIRFLRNDKEFLDVVNEMISKLMTLEVPVTE